MLIEAFTSLSWYVPHWGQVHILTFRSLTDGFLCPQTWQVWLDASNLSIWTTLTPFHYALYFNTLTNSLQETSPIEFARLWFCIIPLTFKSSRQIQSKRFMSFTVNLWMKSILWLWTFCESLQVSTWFSHLVLKDDSCSSWNLSFLILIFWNPHTVWFFCPRND